MENINILSDPLDICRNEAKLSLNCVQKNFCTQFPAYMLKTGLFVIVAYVLLSWLDYWLQEKKGLVKALKPFGGHDFYRSFWAFEIWLPLNTDNPKTWAFWHEILREISGKMLLIFALFVVLLNFY